jgi:uncharacterized protein YidB (DUF937 family)
MGILDSVVSEVGNEFGMSTSSSSSVLSGLLSFITQQEGGLGGFLDRFRRAGVGNTVASWLNGETKAIAPDAVETALGRDTISGIASKAGLSFSSAATAIAFMLPRLIQRLAPGGTVPSRLPADIMSYVTGPTAAIASGARQAVQAAEATVQRSSRRGLWGVLALLALLLVVVFWLARRGAGFDPTEQVRLASEKAMAALANLQPGFGANDLVSALNLYIINFPPASAQLPPESTPFLDKETQVRTWRCLSNGRTPSATTWSSRESIHRCSRQKATEIPNPLPPTTPRKAGSATAESNSLW